MRFAYVNQFDDYTPTFSSEDGSYPGANTQNIHLAKIWKTDGAVTAPTVIVNAASGSTIIANCAAIINHNLTASCAAAIQAHTADTWGTPDLDQAITVQTDGMMLVFFASTEKRYWRFAFNTTALSAALSVGRLWLGQYVAVDQPYNSDPRFPENQTRTDLVAFNRSGQIYATEGVGIKKYKYSFPFMNNSAKTAIQTLWGTVGKFNPFIFTNFDTDYDVVKPVYVSISKDIIFTHRVYDNWECRLELRENK